MRAIEPQIKTLVPAEIHDDPRDLLTSIGSSEALPGISSLVSGAGFKQVHDLPSLEAFLEQYIADILVPLELPAVLSAWQFTEDHHVRELIDLDNELLNNERLKPFRAASCAVGRRQLSKLRPLRDHRVIQRYWGAMDEGRAAAWHTLVYGILTSTYSIPLRQSLVQLAQQTLAGFTLSAVTSLKLGLQASRAMLIRRNADLPPAVNELLRHTPTASPSIFTAQISGPAIT